MISNIFGKSPNSNNFFNNLIVIFVIFIVGFLSFFSYIYNSIALDSIILVIACLNPFYPFVILFGQCAAIVFTSGFFSYLPTFIQTSFTFLVLTRIILFSILRLFIYGFVFKKIIEKYNMKKILNIFIIFGILNVFLFFIYIILFYISNAATPIMKFLPLSKKISIYIKSVPYILKQINSISDIKELVNFSSIGINSMVLNINLFINSSIASFFLSLIMKDPANEMFQKFDRSSVGATTQYKLFCFSFLFLALLLFFLKYIFLALFFFSIFLSFFFLFFIIGRNLLLTGIFERTGNMMLGILILILLMQFIPYFIVILTLLGFVISIFNI